MYRPVIDLLKAYFQIEDRDDGRRMREKVAGKLLMLDRQLEPLLAPVLFLLDAPLQDEGWDRLTPQQRRQQILAGCKQLLIRESNVQPVVLVFEDLHWIDNETHALLDALVESLPTARILLLVNYRPEYQHQWSAKSYYTQLRIAPLTSESATTMLGALLGSDPSLQALKQLLIERSEGNPLFLEESVRTLVETGELVGDRGAYRLTAPVRAVQVSSTVQAILASRIDRLGLEEKRLLQTASVVGKDVPLPLLQTIAELPEERLRDALNVLQGAEFLYEASLFPDIEYTFKHALTHEVAYGSVLQERRKTLHARILEAMESLYSSRISEQTEQLAYHAFRGEVWGKAVAYLREAGSKASSRSANRAAMNFLEQAISSLSHLPLSPERFEQEIGLRATVRRPMSALGESERMVEHAREIGLLGKALNNPRIEALALGYMASPLSDLSRFEEASAYATQALRLAESLNDSIAGLGAKFALGKIYMFRGAYRRAVEFFQRDVGFNPDDISPLKMIQEGTDLSYAGYAAALQSYCDTDTGYCLAELGEFAEALKYCEGALKVSEMHAPGFIRANADAFLGFVYLRQGNFERAIRVTERSLETYSNPDVPHGHLLLAHPAGAAYDLCGRVQDAISVLEQA